jgi:hypothetical protein
VPKFPDDVEAPSFANKIVCAKCGARGRHFDVRPNWKEQPARRTVLRHDWGGHPRAVNKSAHARHCSALARQF